MTQYRITWRHEIIIEAENLDDARYKWENLDLGNMTEAQETDEIISNEFVDDISIDEV